jgi:hypothetical protein
MKTLYIGMFPVVQHTQTHTHTNIYIKRLLVRLLLEAAVLWVLACGYREKLRKTSVRIASFQAKKRKPYLHANQERYTLDCDFWFRA